MKIITVAVALTLLSLVQAGELDDIEVSEEVTDGFRNPIDSVEAIDSSTRTESDDPDDPGAFQEDLETQDAKPGWGRFVRRVKRGVRRVIRKPIRKVRRAIRKVRRFIRRLLPRKCRQSKHYRRGPHVPASRASVSCIAETRYWKQARCWAPRIYYAIGERFKASSVDFFLPHVMLKSDSNRLLQRHCRANNLKPAQGGYLTTKKHLAHPTSVLPFFSGQHPRHSPIYTFYRTFHKGNDVYRDFFYWAFFPYNLGKSVCLGVLASGKCLGKCRWFGNHVGDWEHVTVRLKNNLPFAMYLSAHDFGGAYPYDPIRGTFRKGASPHVSVQRPRFSGNIALHRPTQQVSTSHHGVSGRAVDGNSNPYWQSGSCTHTHSNSKPWWKVDLGHQRYVNKVSITNRFDCCWNRLRNVEIRVGNVNSPDGANILCAHFGGHFGRMTRSFYCSSPSLGRYVFIRMLSPGYLHMCEVKVFAVLSGIHPLLTGNIALRKGTRQISTGYGGHSHKAVDGNRNGHYNHGSCTHTHRHHNPWWRVDLHSRQEVAKVSLTNRADCCWGRLRRIEIRVGNQGHTMSGSSVCTYYPGGLGRGETRLFTCSRPIVGRYVYVRIFAWDWLTLCEVQVYAYKQVNIARGKPTRQSSTAYNWVSSRAVDGKRNGQVHPATCTHTLWTDKPWWRVDLGVQQRVFKVSLSNRADCCWDRLRSFEVRVGNVDRSGSNPRCTYFGAAVGRGSTVYLDCYRPLIGRYVYVRLLRRDCLTLCEVEVFTTIGGMDDLKFTENGHPVVFTSKGSHGFWTRQGIHTYKTIKFNGEKLQDLTSAGLPWDTWKNMKFIRYQKNAKKRPYTGSLRWLNYNGAWGNTERACLKIKIASFRQKQCTLEGGPGSLNTRGSMANHFPLA